LRGGSWNNNPNNLRSANRNNNTPDNRNNNIGFRVVCSLTFPCFYMTGWVDHGLPSALKAFNGASASCLHMKKRIAYPCQAYIETGHPLPSGQDAFLHDHPPLYLCSSRKSP